MKKLLTTCYSRTRALPPNLYQVQTSRSAPHWWHPQYKRVEPDLAPTNIVFAMAKTKGGDWRKAYRKQLEKLHANGRLKEIIDATPDGAVLLCYESDHNDCHRKVLADFLNAKGLAEVSEFPFVPAKDRERLKRQEKKFFL